MASFSTALMSKHRADGDGLLGKSDVLLDVPDAWVADSMEVMSVTIAVDDVVVRGTEVGLVKACCIYGGRLCAFVEPLGFVRLMSEQTHVVECTGRLVVWQAVELCSAVAWHRPDASAQWRVIRM